MAEVELEPSLSRPPLAINFNPPWKAAKRKDKLPREQSFLGRPADPEIVARVRRSLGKFQGPKNGSEREHMIQRKAAEQRKKLMATSEEYLAWTRKVKEETAPCFKFPDDPCRGRPCSEAYIEEKVRTGLHELHERDKAYHAWLHDMEEQHKLRLQEMLEDKACADEMFNSCAEAREQERLSRDAKIQKQSAQQSAQYWQWLRDTKESLAKRPYSVPALNRQTVESVASLTKKKREQSLSEDQVRRAEYFEWLRSVSKPKFTLPYQEVVTWQQHSRAAAAIRKKAEVKATNDYFEGLRKIEQKHHDRIMRSVNEKLNSDKCYNDMQATAEEERNIKTEERKQQQRDRALRDRQALKDMYARVKAKPLFLELAYD